MAVEVARRAVPTGEEGSHLPIRPSGTDSVGAGPNIYIRVTETDLGRPVEKVIRMSDWSDYLQRGSIPGADEI